MLFVVLIFKETCVDLLNWYSLQRDESGSPWGLDTSFFINMTLLYLCNSCAFRLIHAIQGNAGSTWLWYYIIWILTTCYFSVYITIQWTLPADWWQPRQFSIISQAKWSRPWQGCSMWCSFLLYCFVIASQLIIVLNCRQGRWLCGATQAVRKSGLPLNPQKESWLFRWRKAG